MPRISGKRKLLNLLENCALNDLMILEFFCEDEELKKEKENEILEDLMMTFAVGETCRYSVPFLQNSVPKSKYFLTDVLGSMDENRFKKFTRVSPSTFQVLLDLIKHDENFNSARSCKQLPIETQLTIVLYRMGSSGEGASISKIASLFGVGDGGTIQNATDRVFDALLKHKDKYIFWPNAFERQELVTKTWMELPNCIGYVDGTEIPLAEKPSTDPEAYFSRKHVYSLKVQAVCDHTLQIRHLVLGYPGSVHDSRIYNNCELSTRSDEFFSAGQWIAGDSAYKLSKTVITPFRDNSKDLSAAERTFFNKKFSQNRIRVEHCFGRLKERFNSLKSLKIQLKNENSIRKTNKWVLCCALLHNIITQQNEEFDFDLQVPEDDAEFDQTYRSEGISEGDTARRALCSIMLAMD